MVKKEKNQNITPEFRPLFQEAFDKFTDYRKHQVSGNKLVHAFCGVGKSCFAMRCLMHDSALFGSVQLIVMPSISLMSQFNDDYISKYNNGFKSISICSKDETENKDLEFTTEESIICNFLLEKESKILLCTYQSLQTLVTCLRETAVKIDIAVFDEAHKTESLQLKPLIFSDSPFYTMGLFLTATPSEEMKKTMDRICYIPYYQALDHGYLKKFELRIDIERKTTIVKDTLYGHYKSIARTILETDNNRVLTFHKAVVRKGVNDFVHKRKFKLAFIQVLRDEFQGKSRSGKVYDGTIRMEGISANSTNKTQLLLEFSQTLSNSIFILASCETIGEGVDTKTANMCVFADPKKSWKAIIQNIGRVLRFTSGIDDPLKPAAVLLLVNIDFEDYARGETDEEKDRILRDNINNNEDYNGILNVVSALKQDNEEYFNECLNYPSKYDPDKIKNSINKIVVKKGKRLSDILENFPVFRKEKEDEAIDKYARENRLIITMHTNSMEEPLKVYNDDPYDTTERQEVTISRLCDDKGKVEYSIYKECDRRSVEEKYDMHWLSLRSEFKKRLIVKVHTNPDFKVYWKIEDDVFSNYINSGVIDCVIKVVEWEENVEKMKKWYDDNGREIPRNKGNNITDEERYLGGWFGNQKKYFKDGKLKNERIERFKELCKYVKYDLDKYMSIVKKEILSWEENLERFEKWYDDNGKKIPKKEGNITDEKFLSKWFSDQKQSFKNGKLTHERTEKVKELCNYVKYDLDKYMGIVKKEIVSWEENLEKFKKWYDDNQKKIPKKEGNITDEEKYLGSWFSNQKQTFKDGKLKDERIEKFKELSKYIKYDLYKFMSIVKKQIVSWEENLENTKKWYDNNRKKIPRNKGNITDEEKYLGQWFGCQKKNFKDGKLKDERIQKFKQLSKYIKYDLDKYMGIVNKEIVSWEENVENIRKWYDNGKKIHRGNSINITDEEKYLGSWFSNQKKNFKDGKLKDERIEKFKQLSKYINYDLDKYMGIVKKEVVSWEENVENMRKWYDDNAKKIPRGNGSNRTDEEKYLGQWFGHQKKNFKNGKLTPERIEQFKQLSNYINYDLEKYMKQ